MTIEFPEQESEFNNSPFITGMFGPPDVPVGEEQITYSTTKEAVILATPKPTFRVGAIACKDGSDVLATYDDYQTKIYKRQLFLIAEPVNARDDYNYFGTFCMVAMGDEFKSLIRGLKAKTRQVHASIENREYGVLKDFDSMVNYTLAIYKDNYKDNELKRDAIVRAINLELQMTSDLSGVLNKLFGFDELIPEACRWVTKKVREKELKPVNYDYKPGKPYEPLLPIGGLSTSNTTEEKNEKKDGIGELFDDIENAIIYGLQELEKRMVDNLPPFLKAVYLKFKACLNSMRMMVAKAASSLKDATVEYLRIYNAYVCGVVNGFLSLIDMVFTVVGVVADIANDAKLKNLISGRTYARLRNILEHIELIIKFIEQNTSQIWDTLVDFVSKFDGKEFDRITTLVGTWFKEKSRYEWAYLSGECIFQVIVGVVLALVTAGGSLAVEAGGEMAQLLKIIGQEVLSFATMGLSDMLMLVTKLFQNLAKALAKGFKNAVDEIIAFLKRIFAKEEKMAEDAAKAAGDMFHSTSDPVADVLGAGLKSHPERWRVIQDDLRKNKIEIRFKDREFLAYAPGPSIGSPGQLIIHEGASISAIEHEYSHALDDIASGFQGYRVIQDSNYRILSEYRAYMKEIEFINHELSGNRDLIEKLISNFKDELKAIEDFSGPATNQSTIDSIKKLLSQ